jgi:hypothetical protein
LKAREEEAKMQRSNYLTWFRRLLLLGAVVAGMTATAAGAVPIVDPPDTGTGNVAAPVSRPPDIQDTATAAASVPNTTAAGLKADGLRMQAIAQAYQKSQVVPDVFERYATTHAAAVTQASIAPRPPDVSDTALAVRYGSTPTVQSNDFDWSSWAIGIGSGLGLVLLLGTALLMGRQLRHRVQTA